MTIIMKKINNNYVKLFIMVLSFGEVRDGMASDVREKLGGDLSRTLSHVKEAIFSSFFNLLGKSYLSEMGVG